MSIDSGALSLGMMDPSVQTSTSDSVRQKMRLDELRNHLNSGQNEEKKLREACQGFEAVFINKLLKQMRDTVQKSDFLHSPYEDSYMSMFDQELADKLSKDGGIGIGDMLFQQLKERVAGGKDGKIIKAGDTKTPREGAVLPPNRPVTGKGIAVERMPLPKAEPYKAPKTISYDFLSGPAAVTASLNSKRNAKASDAPVSTEPVSTADLPAEDIIAPTQGTITSDYGWRDDPFTGKKAWHAGMDIAAAQGSNVSACWDGKAVFAGKLGGYGNAVILEHEGGWKSVYGHLSEIGVKEGETVQAGRKIAEVGNTGRSTGPHLHFELRRNGHAVNPEELEKSLLAGEPGESGA